VSGVDSPEKHTGKRKKQGKYEECIIIPGKQASQFEKSKIADDEMEQNDEVDYREVLENEVEGKREDIIFVSTGICSQGKATGPEIGPGDEIILVNYLVVHRICKNVVPFTDICLVEWKKRVIQDQDQKNGKNVINNILRGKIPDFFL
jgi:hypothetical protein